MAFKHYAPIFVDKRSIIECNILFNTDHRVRSAVNMICEGVRELGLEMVFVTGQTASQEFDEDVIQVYWTKFVRDLVINFNVVGFARCQCTSIVTRHGRKTLVPEVLPMTPGDTKILRNKRLQEKYVVDLPGDADRKDAWVSVAYPFTEWGGITSPLMTCVPRVRALNEYVDNARKCDARAADAPIYVEDGNPQGAIAHINHMIARNGSFEHTDIASTETHAAVDVAAAFGQYTALRNRLHEHTVNMINSQRFAEMEKHQSGHSHDIRLEPTTRARVPQPQVPIKSGTKAVSVNFPTPVQDIIAHTEQTERIICEALGVPVTLYDHSSSRMADVFDREQMTLARTIRSNARAVQDALNQAVEAIYPLQNPKKFKGLSSFHAKSDEDDTGYEQQERQRARKKRRTDSNTDAAGSDDNSTRKRVGRPRKDSYWIGIEKSKGKRGKKIRVESVRFKTLASPDEIRQLYNEGFVDWEAYKECIAPIYGYSNIHVVEDSPYTREQRFELERDKLKIKSSEKIARDEAAKQQSLQSQKLDAETTMLSQKLKADKEIAKMKPKPTSAK